MVTMTPALVPTQSMSLQARMVVILRQAALCCLMISSQPYQQDTSINANENT